MPLSLGVTADREIRGIHHFPFRPIGGAPRFIAAVSALADDSFQAGPYAISMIRRVACCATHLSAGLGQRDVHIAQVHSRRAGIGEGDR